MSQDFELLYYRARDGARGAQVGLRRVEARLRRAEAEAKELYLALTYEKALRWKAEAENRSLTNKVERLSLRIIDLWGKERGILEEEGGDARKQDG